MEPLEISFCLSFVSGGWKLTQDRLQVAANCCKYRKCRKLYFVISRILLRRSSVMPV